MTFVPIVKASVMQRSNSVGVDYNATLVFQLKRKRLLSFVRFAFGVKDDHYHSVRDGLRSFRFGPLFLNLMNAMQAPMRKPFKTLASCIKGPKLLREFAKFVKTCSIVEGSVFSLEPLKRTW